MQDAFAWAAHELDAELQVRLETHPKAGVRIDLLLFGQAAGRYTAVELKYLTAGWDGECRGEAYHVKNHGAQDVRAYDSVKDIGRLERFVLGNHG